MSQGRYNAPRRGTLGYCPGWGEQQQLQLAALSSPGCLCPSPRAFVAPPSCSVVLGSLHPALSIPTELMVLVPACWGARGKPAPAVPYREAASSKVFGVCAPSRGPWCRGGAMGWPCCHHHRAHVGHGPVHRDVLGLTGDITGSVASGLADGDGDGTTGGVLGVHGARWWPCRQRSAGGRCWSSAFIAGDRMGAGLRPRCVRPCRSGRVMGRTGTCVVEEGWGEG